MGYQLVTRLYLLRRIWVKLQLLWVFFRVLALAVSEVIDSASEYFFVLGLVFVNFNVFSKDYFLALTLAWPDSIDHIILMSCIGERVTLKGFCMNSSPAMLFPSLSFLGRVTCLGRAVIFSRSNLYWLTSERSSAVITLGTRFSSPRYVMISMSWCGTRLQKLAQFRESSGRLRLKTRPSFVCWPHWRKASSGFDFDLGFFNMMLYDDMNRGEVYSVVRGRWNCSGWIESMGMTE